MLQTTAIGDVLRGGCVLPMLYKINAFKSPSRLVLIVQYIDKCSNCHVWKPGQCCYCQTAMFYDACLYIKLCPEAYYTKDNKVID